MCHDSWGVEESFKMLLKESLLAIIYQKQILLTLNEPLFLEIIKWYM